MASDGGSISERDSYSGGLVKPLRDIKVHQKVTKSKLEKIVANHQSTVIL